MLRGIPLVVLALSVAVVAGYIEVYVEDGPDLDGLHIYAWDGGEWVPVHVTYVPEYIDTYIAAVGQWASMPYYNMSRYVLQIPSEAFRRGPPRTPPGLERWTLEVQNGTRKTAVELAVGRTPITKENLTLTTWYSLGDQPPKTPHRGKFINPPRRPPKNNEAAGEAGTASYAVSPSATIYPIGSLYFKPAKVRSGSFGTYVPVDTPIGYNTICTGLPEVHWVGFEVQNFTVGVKVSGTIYYGTLTLEFYNINLDGTCTLITRYSTWLPGSGSRWENVNVQLPRDSQIGVRVRVDGYAPYDAIINVSVVARYVKTVNNLAQIATTKATTPSPTDVSFSSQLYGQRDRIAVLFGPFVAYDGLAATAAGTSFSYIYVPPHTMMLQWTGQCPFLSVEYYVNGVFITGSFVGPTSSYPYNGYCYYDVSSTVLQLRARDYVISKALSRGGGIMVSVVYRNPLGFPFVKISFRGSLEIVYDRWIEPFHSNYLRGTGDPYLEWGVTLLLNTYQVLGSINATAINVISEIRSSTSQLVLSLAHNQLDSLRYICGAEWVITVPVSGPKVYYGNELVEKPWWAALGLRVLDSADWFITLSGISGGKGLIASILVKVAQNIFLTASATVSISSSSGIYTVRWTKGWAESPPHTVVITLDRELSSTPRYTEWRYFREAYQSISYPCAFGPQRVVGTNMYLPPRTPAVEWATAKIWTWRGQTRILTGPLEVGSR
jgi:hypothetical protein